MRVSAALIAGALLVGAAETHAEQRTVADGVRLAPQGAAKPSPNSGSSNPYSRLFEPAGRIQNPSQVPAASGVRLAPQGAAKASQKPGTSNPYGRLFAPTGRVQNPSHAPAANRPTEPQIVKCGMRLIPGDPSIDAGIVVPVDKSTTKSHVRGVEPSMCW